MLQPTELDVVLGKGRALKEAGNEGYRALIAKNRVLYSRNPEADKRKVVMGVISAIKLSGGRFLNKDKQTGTYHLQSDEEISKSVSNVIRGGAPGIRKEIYAFERRTGVPPQTKEYDEEYYIQYSVYTLAGIRGNPMEKAWLSQDARELLNLSVLEEVIECDDIEIDPCTPPKSPLRPEIEFDVARLLAGKLDPYEPLEFNDGSHPVLQRQLTDVTEIAGNTSRRRPPRQVSAESFRASWTSTASDEDKDTFETSNMDLFTRFTRRGSHRSIRTGLTDCSSDDEMSTFSRITRRESQRSIMTGVSGLSGLSGLSDMSPPHDDMSLVSRLLPKRGSVRSLQTGSSSSSNGRSGKDLDLQMEVSDTSPHDDKLVSRRMMKRGSARSIRTGISSLSTAGRSGVQLEVDFVSSRG